MDKKPKGKPKKAAAPRRDSRVKPAKAKKRTPLQDLMKTERAPSLAKPKPLPFARLKPTPTPEKPKVAKPRRKRIAPSLVGSDRPKVSLFMNRKDRDRAHAVAGSRKVSLTALLEELILRGLSKKVKK